MSKKACNSRKEKLDKEPNFSYLQSTVTVWKSWEWKKKKQNTESSHLYKTAFSKTAGQKKLLVYYTTVLYLDLSFCGSLSLIHKSFIMKWNVTDEVLKETSG